MIPESSPPIRDCFHRPLGEDSSLMVVEPHQDAAHEHG